MSFAPGSKYKLNFYSVSPKCDEEGDESKDCMPFWQHVVVALVTGAAPTLVGYALHKLDSSLSEEAPDMEKETGEDA